MEDVLKNLKASLSVYEAALREGRVQDDLIWRIPETGICFARPTVTGQFGGCSPLAADAVRPTDRAPIDGDGRVAVKVPRHIAVTDAMRDIKSLMRDLVNISAL